MDYVQESEELKIIYARRFKIVEFPLMRLHHEYLQTNGRRETWAILIANKKSNTFL